MILLKLNSLKIELMVSPKVSVSLLLDLSRVYVCAWIVYQRKSYTVRIQ